MCCGAVWGERTRESSQKVCMPPFPTTKWVARPPWTCLLYLADLHRRRGAGDSNACRWTVNAMRCAHSEFFDDTVAQHSLRSLTHSAAAAPRKPRTNLLTRDLKLWIIGRSLDVRATLCVSHFTRVTPFWEEHKYFSTAIMLMTVFRVCVGTKYGWVIYWSGKKRLFCSWFT